MGSTTPGNSTALRTGKIMRTSSAFMMFLA
jgi:hypothetical protein